MLGRAKRVLIEKEKTTIVSGAGDPERIEGRVNQFRAQIEDTTSDYDREKLEERLAKLAGGVAVIRVGGATESEVKERKDRVEDAMHATRAAAEEGSSRAGVLPCSALRAPSRTSMRAATTSRSASRLCVALSRRRSGKSLTMPAWMRP